MPSLAPVNDEIELPMISKGEVANAHLYQKTAT